MPNPTPAKQMAEQVVRPWRYCLTLECVHNDHEQFQHEGLVRDITTALTAHGRAAVAKHHEQTLIEAVDEKPLSCHICRDIQEKHEVLVAEAERRTWAEAAKFSEQRMTAGGDPEDEYERGMQAEARTQRDEFHRRAQEGG